MTRRLYIDGHALWTPHAAGERPAPPLLAANERRRAPDSVLVAIEVAQAAVQAAGRDAAGLASVFTSAHGDLTIVDALCKTLASDPLMLSPTRFHHSVHNAASGYWAIGTHAHAPSTAIAACGHSFAAGWLEAACQCAADQRALLLAGFDTDARGALASVNRSRGLLGVALVLAPQRSEHSRWAVDWTLRPGAFVAERADLGAHVALATNAMADALPLFAALEQGEARDLTLALSDRLAMRLTLAPLPA